IDAALALIGFDQEKDKAITVLKEELGKTKVPPLDLFLDRIPALEDKLKGTVPELMAFAPRLLYENQRFYRLLGRMDPKGGMSPEMQKLLKSPGLKGHAAAELLQRIDAKDPDA